MSKPLLRWLVTSVLVSSVLFALFSYFDSTERGFGWALLGLIMVSGIFGFSYCVTTSPRDNHGINRWDYIDSGADMADY